MIDQYDVDVAFNQLWPVDGPVHPDRTRIAAHAVPELIAYLNITTMPIAERDTLPHIADVHQLFVALHIATSSQKQLLDQLRDSIRRHAKDSTLTDRRPAENGVVTAGWTQEAIHDAIERTGELQEVLDKVRTWLGNLDHSTTPYATDEEWECPECSGHGTDGGCALCHAVDGED